MLEENKALIRRFVSEVINKGNIDAIDEFVPSNFIELDPLPGQEQGRDGFKQKISMMLDAFPGQQWVVQEQIAEGDKVVSKITWVGTHRQEFLGVPATGKEVMVSGVEIDRVVNGQLVESQLLMDIMGLMLQLGVTIGEEDSAASAEY